MTKTKKKILQRIAAVTVCSAMCVTVCACAPDSAEEEDKYYKESTISTTSTQSGYTEENGKFYSDYKTLDDAHLAGKDLNIRIAEEGMVLMKNENNALPLNRDERNVTLLGIKSVDIQTGGGGSGNGNPGSSTNTGENSYKVDPTSLVGSMENAGFRLNKKVLELYENNIANMTYEEYSESSGSTQTLLNELPMSYYNNMITKTYRAYGDAAILTFSRSGAEGLDHIAHEDSHVLQLTASEKALVKHAKANFKKVVVLVNTGNVIELGELNAPKDTSEYGVDAVLYVGHVGNNGAEAIGEILNGTVNPSGRAVDLWSADITKDPSYTNFGDMGQNGSDYDNYIYNGNTKTNYHSVEYREGIYVGYRYYETVAEDLNNKEAGSGDTWYNENVVYPFGYGLSYTTFDWQLDEDIAPDAVITAANTTVTMKVKVTNTGDVAGKDVVQIYAQQPYTVGGIEKAARVLVAFGKTEILQPGHSQTLTMQFAAQDMASFDWNDKNENGFVGYELEAGNYVISAQRDSHTPVLSVNRFIRDGINCATDLETGNEITAVFSQSEGAYAEYNTTNESLLNNLISRADGLTQPKAATKSDRTVNQAWVDLMKSYEEYSPETDDASHSLWNVNAVPSTWTQAASHQADFSDISINISDMSGVGYVNSKVSGGTVTQGTDADTKKWESFLNQLTWEELVMVSSQGMYGRPSIEAIDMPFQLDIDGPCQIAWYGNQQAANYYPSEVTSDTANGMGTFWLGAVLIASTWNEELAEEQGVMVGNESILTNSPGWYGPGANMHRSALGGRNFEYYSEDPVLAGKIVSKVVKGATSKGTICYIKHMFLNDQETDRGGICTYATEQAIREIYLKPYEMAIKEGRTLGTMGGGNRVGNHQVYTCYALYNGILKNEWDYKGMNITDSFGARTVSMDMDLMTRAGIDVPLGIGSGVRRGDETRNQNDTEGVWDATANTVKVNNQASPSQWYAVRTAAMHVLYATANSNGIDNGVIKTPQKVTFNGGMYSGYLVEPKAMNCIAFSDVVEVEEATVPYGQTVYNPVDSTNSVLQPLGVTLSSDGTIAGNFNTAGVHKVLLSVRADGWVPVILEVEVTVKDSIAYSGSLTPAAGDISGTFSTSIYKAGETMLVGLAAIGPIPAMGLLETMYVPASATCEKVEYTSTDLTTGLTLAIDGTLSGTLSAGTYIFNVTVTASATYMYYGIIPGTLALTYTQSVTITVS